MKWFQHSTDSYNDPDISDAEDLFGDAGYSVFFKILEIYGREFNSINSDGFLNISQTFLRRKCRKSWTKVQQILNFYQTKNRIFYENDNKMVSICIPKFLELSDNWTKRVRKEQPLKLQSNYRATPAIEEEEKKKDIYSIKIQKEKFDLFWDAFNFKKGRTPALKSWMRIKMNDDLFNKIIKGAKQYCIERKEIIKRGGTPKWAQGWLTDKRWEDEGESTKPKLIPVETIKTWAGMTNKEREAKPWMNPKKEKK